MVTRLISSCGAAAFLLLTLACGSTSVSQITAPDPARCGASVGTVPTLPAGGGRVDVAVVTARECAWSATSNTSWIQLSPTAGQGEASITLTGTANPQGVARNGNISINGSQFAVTQAPSPCTFSLSQTSASVAAAGGTASTRVVTLTGCTWTASSPESWANIQTRSGNGETQVGVAVSANPGSSPRTASLAIAGQNFTITQDGTAAPPPSPSPGPAPAPSPSPGPTPSPSPQLCVILIDPITRFVKARGGDETVKVETGATCTWKAVSNVSWVTVRGSGEGSGSRELKYDVDRNASNATRTGTISIAGVPHFIVQAPADDD